MTKYKVLGLGLGVALAGLAGFGLVKSDLLKDWSGPVASLGGVFQITPEKPAISAAELARIAPHKALYKIEMVQKRGGSQVLNIYGDMFFEWRSACEAWSTDHRFNLNYEYPDSQPMRITSDFTTYERFDGKSFDFHSRRRRDGEMYEQLRGRATLPKNGAEEGGRAVFTMPADLAFDLSPDTVFPMGHTLGVLRAIKDKQVFFDATIFDGSDTEGPTAVNAFIGKPADTSHVALDSVAIDAALLTSPARHIRLAFFPLKSTEPDSDYEMSVILHENGVISDMYVEYKDFSVTQKLVGLESLKAESCEPATAAKR